MMTALRSPSSPQRKGAWRTSQPATLHLVLTGPHPALPLHMQQQHHHNDHSMSRRASFPYALSHRDAGPGAFPPFLGANEHHDLHYSNGASAYALRQYTYYNEALPMYDGGSPGTSADRLRCTALELTTRTWASPPHLDESYLCSSVFWVLRALTPLL